MIQLERESRDFKTVLRVEEEASIAAITASEMIFGVLMAGSSAREARRRQFVEAAFEEFSIIAFDLEIARIHAHLSVETRKAGLPVGTHDLQIAATAIAHGLDLITLNVREFSQVPGLTVRQPSW